MHCFFCVNTVNVNVQMRLCVIWFGLYVGWHGWHFACTVDKHAYNIEWQCEQYKYCWKTLMEQRKCAYFPFCLAAAAAVAAAAAGTATAATTYLYRNLHAYDPT